jgi:glycosyltransferase involved in cell wall biosynthesis
MRSPRVSVLLSVFNGGTFLGPAVASVLAQTGPSLELIAVDDASTDGSAELLEQVARADSRLRVVRNAQNQGLVVNLNRGIELARGEFIARIDADDLHRPGKLAAQVAEMDASPSLVLLGTNYEYVDAAGTVFKRENPETDRKLLKERLETEGNQLCHSSVMFRADLARNLGGYRMLAGRYAQDYDLWLRLSERGEIGCLPGHLTAYRCHDEMLSLTRLAQQRRAAEIYREIGRQRRAGRSEDLSAASHQVDTASAHLRTAVARDYLRWSSLYAKMGSTLRSRQMWLQAVKTAPFSMPVRQSLVEAAQWRLTSVADGLRKRGKG